jgi:hypothetical protein
MLRLDGGACAGRGKAERKPESDVLAWLLRRRSRLLRRKNVRNGSKRAVPRGLPCALSANKHRSSTSPAIRMSTR